MNRKDLIKETYKNLSDCLDEIMDGNITIDEIQEIEKLRAMCRVIANKDLTFEGQYSRFV